jgi:hypothetical protein
VNDSEYKVRVESDGVVYRGRHSVHQRGSHVYIDGKLVGVEVNNDGNSLSSAVVRSSQLSGAGVICLSLPMRIASLLRRAWCRLVGRRRR